MTIKSFLISSCSRECDKKIADGEEKPIKKSGLQGAGAPPILLLKKYRTRIKKDA